MLKWYLQDPTFFLLPLPQSWLYSRCGSLCPWQISPASQPTPLQSFRLVKPSVLTTQKNSVRAPPTAGYPRGNPSLCREEPALSPVRAALHLSGRPWNRTQEPSAHCTGRDNALEWGEDAPALRWPVEGLELEQIEPRIQGTGNAG